MAITFKLIAEEAGVSYSTVSRVINDHPSVSPESAKAVKRAMKRLNYRPPPPECRRGPQRGMPSRVRSGTIALLFPDVNRNAMRTPLSAALAHGVEDVLYAQKVGMLVMHLREQGRLPPALEAGNVDGVIIRGGQMSERLLNRLRSYPCVWIFQTPRPLQWADQISADNEAIGQLALEYLTAVECSRLIAWNPGSSHPSFQKRVTDFSAAAEGADVEIDTVDTDAGTLARRILNTSPTRRPDGVFCAAGDESIEVFYRALAAGGMTPCRDIHIISCNNDLNRLRALDPLLPNIDIQPELIGRVGSERLLARLADPTQPHQRILVAPRLDAPAE